MAGLTRAQEVAIDQLVAASPDVLLSRLESVLARTDGERVRVVRARIAEEAADRRVRTAVYGPAAALALLDDLPPDRGHLVPAIRADLLRRLGREAEAAAAYDEALTRAQNAAERSFLQRRRAELR